MRATILRTWPVNLLKPETCIRMEDSCLRPTSHERLVEDVNSWSVRLRLRERREKRLRFSPILVLRATDNHDAIGLPTLAKC